MATALYADNELVVESLREGYKDMFSKRGHNLLTAENGQIVLEIICQQPVDMLFLDVSMPVMNGYEVLAALKEKNSQIPVVMCSGEGDRIRKDVEGIGYEHILGYCTDIDGQIIESYLGREEKPAPSD